MMGDAMRCTMCGAVQTDALVGYLVRRGDAEEGHCAMCQREGTTVPCDTDGISPFEYVHWDLCHSCEKTALVSSGTGSCRKCDGIGPDEDDEHIRRTIVNGMWKDNLAWAQQMLADNRSSPANLTEHDSRRLAEVMLEEQVRFSRKKLDPGAFNAFIEAMMGIDDHVPTSADASEVSDLRNTFNNFVEVRTMGGGSPEFWRRMLHWYAYRGPTIEGFEAKA